MQSREPSKSSWKDKVDPAFDKIIKHYIQFIELIGLPANTGWIGLGEEALKIWENKGMQGWIKRYEKNMTTEKNTIITWKIAKNVTRQERIKARHDIEKDLLKEIKTLPEDSQAYYKRCFAPFYSEKFGEDYFGQMTIEKLKKLYTDFFCDYTLLSMHQAMIEMASEVQNSPKEALEKKYIRQSMILDMLLGIYNSISLLVFEKSYTDLIKEARDGNKKSFFSLLRIDRTAVECDWAQKIIRKAQLTGDETFFKLMAKAISKAPLENAKQFTTARIVLLLFWSLGLRKLESHERLELLEECGLKLQQGPEAFERFERRLIREVKKDIVTFQKDTPAS